MWGLRVRFELCSPETRQVLMAFLFFGRAWEYVLVFRCTLGANPALGTLTVDVPHVACLLVLTPGLVCGDFEMEMFFVAVVSRCDFWWREGGCVPKGRR